MPSGLPARVAFVCTLVCGAIAYAERRPVAVIDLSDDNKKTVELAVSLHRVLTNHPELQPITDPLIPVELYGESPDDDRQRQRNAEDSKLNAVDRLARFQAATAYENAQDGIALLESTNPTPGVVLLLSQLAFIKGQASLGIPSRVAEAREAFALAHRLEPSFVPDAARYLPEVVSEFEAAKRAWSGKGTLSVVGEGRLWIDGIDSGVAPKEINVDAGPHVVWLTGTDRVTTGRQVIVAAGKTEKVEIENKPADLRLRVRRARAALRYAPDPAARAAAMKVIADLVGVRDAVLLSSGANKEVIYQTWNAGTREKAPGFSALRVVVNEKAIDLLAGLADPKPKVEPEQPSFEVKALVDKKRWHEHTPVRAALVVGFLASAIGIYYGVEALNDKFVGFGTNIGVSSRGRP